MTRLTAETARTESFWLWTLPLVYGLHVMEEQSFGWVAWANHQGLAFDWPDFFLTNAMVVTFGICAAAIGHRKPALSLSYPALMLINGTIFHLVPTVLSGRPNPGFLTALLLFLPLGFILLRDARRSGSPWTTIGAAFAIAAALQLFPLLLLALRTRLAWAA